MANQCFRPYTPDGTGGGALSIFMSLEDMSAWGLGQTGCVTSLPTNTSSAEAAARWAATPEDQKATRRAPIVAQLTAAGVTADPAVLAAAADARILQELTASVDTERSALRLCPVAGEVARQVFAETLAARGLRPDLQATYGRDLLLWFRDELVRRGVPAAESGNVVRQEVWRNLLRADPAPGADLEELIVRLSYAPPPPPPLPVVPASAPAPAGDPPGYTRGAAGALMPPYRGPALRPRQGRQDTTPAWLPWAVVAGLGVAFLATRPR